jgi:hypothetical protein
MSATGSPSEPAVLPCFTQQQFRREQTVLLKKARGLRTRGRPSGSKNPVPNAAEICKDWDWTKSNSALAFEHGVSPWLVTKYRRLLGKPVSIKTSKWIKIDVSGWDWSLQSMELARQHKLSVGDVYKLRVYHHAPPPIKPLLVRPAAPDVVPVRWDSLDWDKPDVQIAAELGRTRERVRQARAQLGKPRRTKHQKKFEAFVAALNGKTQITTKDIAATGVSHTTGRLYVAKAGLVYVPSRGRYKCRPEWAHMNFCLPNGILSDIWRIPYSVVANYRCGMGLPSPEWRKRWKTGIPPEHQAEVDAERAKAAEFFSQQSQTSTKGTK